VSDMGIRAKMLVKDVMSSPVVTLDEDGTADKVAKIMAKNGFGAVVINDAKGKAIGIITERDLVKRVIAKNSKPSTVKAKDIMTSPLATIEPDASVSEAARRMTRLDIRRLGVFYKGNLVGIVSSKDLLSVMPELIEIMQETNKIECDPASQEEAPISGYCDRCEAYSEGLKNVNGQNLCDDCRLEVEHEDEPVEEE
jgi:CBS domain-containing protein